MTLDDKKSLHEKCPYLELFWSAFSRIRCEDSLRIRKKYRAEQIQMRTLFTQLES